MALFTFKLLDVRFVGDVLSPEFGLVEEKTGVEDELIRAAGLGLRHISSISSY